ncbi:GrpB family protein [Dactylosporangium sp. CA-139066]|uniref:GrpB family protein n=1 Tax=Dactylosporangium sp. CA-139066 TaxID=3239930 RepID=UPI003D8CB9D0
MTIEVHDYDPAWPALAAVAIDDVRAAMPGRIGVIEHVGSTAVPGLAAKPVIDLMAATEDLGDFAAHEAPVLALGYQRLETGMRERLFYRRDGYHLHVVGAQSWPTRNERLLRDHLLADPAAREEYAGLKRSLAGLDGDTYTRSKTELIQRLVDAARTARGLPLVDVWED